VEIEKPLRIIRDIFIEKTALNSPRYFRSSFLIFNISSLFHKGKIRRFVTTTSRVDRTTSNICSTDFEFIADRYSRLTLCNPQSVIISYIWLNKLCYNTNWAVYFLLQTNVNVKFPIKVKRCLRCLKYLKIFALETRYIIRASEKKETKMLSAKSTIK